MVQKVYTAPLETVKSFPQIRLIKIRPEEFGHGRTRNLGAKEAKGKYLVFLNRDAWPADEYWLANLLINFEKDDKVAGVFSRQIPRKGANLFVGREIGDLFPPLRIIRTKEDFEKAVSKKFDLFKSQLKKVLLFSTVSAAIRKDIFDLFPFDDEILFAEDQEWAKRVLQAGFKIVYEPNSVVYHSHTKKLFEYFSPRDLSVVAFNKILERKTTGPLWALPYFLFNLLFETFVDIPYILKYNVSELGVQNRG